ncbi:hypothetical protein [Brucella intermedia]|uniref:hypothetical protein n=1 Tax=Brucella intermedia TaxID=94625 RepID=UPI00224B96F8|nr:hypothetical protein [Brucella intermedia]
MAAKRMRTSRQQLIEEPATLADRTANGAGADAEPAHKLALEEVKTSGATDVRGLIKTYANAAFEQQGKDIPKYIWHLHFEEFATAIRALSSPDHADAGKVEGDGWLPKAAELYDKCKLFPETSAEGFMALLQLRNHVAEILPSAPSQEVVGS